ncbi:anhydro-N-acetylmuramic acid kinase [Fodinibius roseus]|uniref:Anhydro-N-acetylmuramic acid kinase n=1 Tax=Fodinibius roseus TaxID=1194090 RepID=A0A1M4XBX2_9BACT|nr:anhydro-N-acetylmuramic acid kinase [Fodinibius roseus]SHE90796.1 anhydro-N-acetylmuramic acid kinase [Fodinibius roseus]
MTSLTTVAQKEVKLVLGLMSGTSMDGLDLALCRITGSGVDTGLELLEFSTQSYSRGLQEKLKEIVSVPQCRLEDVCLMNSYLADYTGDTILETLKEWGRGPDEIDCIASHGQTVYHAPVSKHRKPGFPHATLQIGDGDHLAHRTGILTLSDFRQKHTAAGGEGAPMAALVDRLLFGHPEKDRLLLNIGGIANFTYLPAACTGGEPVSGDTGPGNTLLDKTARRLFGKPFDEEGKAARRGSVNQPLLKALKADPYFDLDLPKTTGPELFNGAYVHRARQASGVKDIRPEDLLATLTTFTAETISDAVKEVVPPSPALEVLVSGGGIHNAYLMETLKRSLTGATFVAFGETYFNADAKEAACFAVLANETLSGEGFSVDPYANRGQQMIHLGKISFPD